MLVFISLRYKAHPFEEFSLIYALGLADIFIFLYIIKN
jgi:hypothetical protein